MPVREFDRGAWLENGTTVRQLTGGACSGAGKLGRWEGVKLGEAESQSHNFLFSELHNFITS